MVSCKGLACGLVALIAVAAANGDEWPLRVTALKSGCSLKILESGRDQPVPWLVCPQSRFLLLGLANLEGQVHIRTATQALEFVRTFSRPDTWFYSQTDRMIEVTEGPPDQARFVVSATKFRRCCTAPTATARKGERSAPEFIVTRTIVEPDYRVYVITQTVEENGAVWVNEKRLIQEDGRNLGSFFNPYVM